MISNDISVVIRTIIKQNKFLSQMPIEEIGAIYALRIANCF